MKKIVRFLFTLFVCLSVGIVLTACTERDEEHTHNLTKVPAIAPSCETAGNSEYYICTCGKYFSDANAETEIAKDSWVIAATGHTNSNLTKVLAIAPSCETAGNSEYYVCTCGKYFSDANAETEIAKDSWVIAATGHTYSEAWSYNETHHWKEANCEHKSEKSEYTEHSIIDNKCSCGWSAEVSIIRVEGKTFKFVSSDTDLPVMTYTSGNAVFKADGSIEINMKGITNIDGMEYPVESTAIGTYIQNENQIVFSFIGCNTGGEFIEYPEAVAELFKNLNGVIEGNKVILGCPYVISSTESGVEHLTFELE